MRSHFFFTQTSLLRLWIAQRKDFEDDRGAFGRMFCAKEFQKIGVNKSIVQINRSITKKKGLIRGLHFQYSPHSEMKIISCLKGEIFDVAVDLRFNSETFLSWHGERLSCENQKSIIIPEGFAHGFQTLTDNCELLYLHTEFYTPEVEGGIHVEDSRVNIQWPLPIEGLSKRDKGFAFINDDYMGEQI